MSNIERQIKSLHGGLYRIVDEEKVYQTDTQN